MQVHDVVIVGAGPAGLEAARVASERGHRVILFEAADRPGGQIRLTAQNARRREMIGIIGGGLAGLCAAYKLRDVNVELARLTAGSHRT